MECINDIKSINVRRSALYDVLQIVPARQSVVIFKCNLNCITQHEKVQLQRHLAELI